MESGSSDSNIDARRKARSNTFRSRNSAANIEEMFGGNAEANTSQVAPSKSGAGVDHDGSLEDNFLKVGDLIFFGSDDNHVIYGEGVGTLFGRQNNEDLATNFLGAIFRVQPKYEFNAKKELAKLLDSNSQNAAKLERLQEAVASEKKRNEEEERVLAGSIVYYGQTVQLVHFGTNMLLCGDKKARADLDPTSLKLSLVKEGSKSSWFKIMPRYKVRFEGEEIRRGDKVCLIHIPSGMFVYLSDKKHEDNGFHEVSLNSNQTGWSLAHFASFQPKSENFIKAGDVIRIFHQEKEGFLKANITALFNNLTHEVFVKCKGKKGNVMESNSSNTLFQVELRNNLGGMIGWRSEIRLKHLGTRKYLCVNPKKGENGKLSLQLTTDLKAFDQETLFIFNPVDPGNQFTSYGTYCRIQSKKNAQTNKIYWLHVGNYIDSATTQEDGKFLNFARNKFLELQFTERFHYEDAVLFKPVKPVEIEELNYVNSLYAVLIEFINKIDVEAPSPNISKSRSRGGNSILPIDTDPIKDSLRKLITFVNQSTESDPLKQDGIPIPSHQVLLLEQQVIEACIDVLVRLFGFNTKAYGKGISADVKDSFNSEVQKKENSHIKEIVVLIYKFFQMIVKGNKKIGIRLATWLNIFLTHMGSGVGVRKTLNELFKDNRFLLENISEQYMNTFVQLLLESGKDAKLLEFLTTLCTCGDEPVFRNQMFIIGCLQNHPQLLLLTRPGKTKGIYEINVGTKEEVWIPMEEFIRARVYKRRKTEVGSISDLKKNLEKADKEESRKTFSKEDFAYPYNTRYMKEIDYFKQLLQLFYKSSMANEKAIQFLGEGDKSKNIKPLLSADQVFDGLRNDQMPGSVRASYCDLLNLWIDNDLPPVTSSGIKYTWAWDEITKSYQVKRSLEDPDGKKDTWVQRHFKELESFIFDFVANNQDIGVEDYENRTLLLSVLTFLEKLISYGFFISQEDQSKLIPLLIGLLDGKKEKTGGGAAKFQRYEMSEATLPIMKAKLQICKILHSFYDIRLEKRTAEQLNHYKEQYESNRDDAVKDLKKNVNVLAESDGFRSGTAIAQKMDAHLDLDPASEIELHSITYTDSFGEKLQRILLDTLLYHYEPLTTSALSLLLRHMRSRDELLHTLERVQLLTDDKSVQLFKHISKQLSMMKVLLEDNDISDEDMPQIIEILKDFIKTCNINEDMNRPNPKTQTIFRNLGVHTEVLRILEMHFKQEYHYVFKLCYLFFRQFVMNNKVNQSLLFTKLDFYLSQMGMQLNIADTLIALVKENYNLCSQLDQFFIGHMIKLLNHKGRKPKYINLLDAIVVAEDKPIKENQTLVTNLIMAKRDVIINDYSTLKKKKLESVQGNLIARVGKSEENEDEDDDTEGKELSEKKKQLARLNTTLGTMADSIKFKIDLDTYEAMLKNKLTKEDEDLLYHVGMIDLLAKCCSDKNHATESLCQSAFPVQDVMKIIRDPEAGSLLKAAYTRFLTECWLFTERPLNLQDDVQMWELVRFYKDDLKATKLTTPMNKNYVLDGLFSFLRTFFALEFPELSKERIAIVNDIMTILCDMLNAYKNDSSKLTAIANTIVAIQQSNITGIKNGGEKVDQLLETAKKRIGTLSGNTLKAIRAEAIEEKRKLVALRAYVRTLSEDAHPDGTSVLEEEVAAVVKLFKSRLMEKDKKHVPSTNAVKKPEKKPGKKSKEQTDVKSVKGPLYVKKLIEQLKSDDDDKKLVIDVMKILSGIINLDDAPLQSMAKKLGIKQIGPNEVKQLSLKWKEKTQNRLGALGLMQQAIDLLKSPNPDVIYNALTLCCDMLAGGNRKIQESMMKFFLSTPDPHFFDDMRNRIAGAVGELKAHRRQQSVVRRRNLTSNASALGEDSDFLEELLEGPGHKKKEQGNNISKLLLFMQNLCEGHYTEMKDYLRDQWDNTKSFNLVKECVSFAIELERSVESNWELANQLFRTLNEFCSGCPSNQITIVEAKIYVPFNRILLRIPRCNEEEILELKGSMLDLLLSLVEGLYPGKESPTSFLPETLLLNIDFAALETTVSNALKFSKMNKDDFDFLKDQFSKTQQQFKASMKNTQKYLKLGRASRTSSNAMMRTSSQLELGKETAESLEESEKAKDLVSKGLVLMEILSEFDLEKKTQVKHILRSNDWPDYIAENVGTIEVLNDAGGIEKVYFPIPEVCQSLQPATKDEFLQVVKRESPTDKIDDFVRRSSTLRYEIYHHNKLASSRFHWLGKFYTPIRNLLTLISLVVNGLIIGLYQGDELLYEDVIRIVFFGLCIAHFIISTFWVGVYLWNWAPVIIFRRMKDREEEIREQNLLLKKLGKKPKSDDSPLRQAALKTGYLLSDGMIVYHTMFWIFSGLSIKWPPLMCFHMIDISVRSEGVINVVKAVTTNGKSLILTAILLVILIYMYTIIGYFGVPTSYPGVNCQTLYYCILFNINAGIRNGGGIGDVLNDVTPLDGSVYFGRFFLDITFFLIIIILGLNIVFGIILDTFGELRDRKSFIEEDMRSVCFICGIDSDTFQRQASGFKHHIKHDHNMWRYLYFLIYLDNKDQDEYSYIEDYVAEKRKKGENDYFPIGKAICLEKKKD